MGVGNLNVSVTADTRAAIANLRSFSNELRDTGQSAAQAAREFQGLTINDLTAKLRAGAGTRDLLPPLRDAENWRMQIIDLRSQQGRYNDELLKSNGLLKDGAQLASMMSKAGRVIGLSGLVAVASFKFGNLIGEYQQGMRSLEKDIESVKAAASNMFERVFDPRLAAHKEQKAAASEIGRQLAAERAAEEKRRAAEEKQALKERQDAWGRTLADQHRANNLANARMRELEREAKLEDARQEKQRRWDEYQERERRNRIEDAKTVRDVEKEVADFWKSDRLKRRESVLGSIEDPKMRSQAREALDNLEAAEWVKENHRLNREASSRGGQCV